MLKNNKCRNTSEELPQLKTRNPLLAAAQATFREEEEEEQQQQQAAAAASLLLLLLQYIVNVGARACVCVCVCVVGGIQKLQNPKGDVTHRVCDSVSLGLKNGNSKLKLNFGYFC